MADEKPGQELVLLGIIILIIAVVLKYSEKIDSLTFLIMIIIALALVIVTRRKTNNLQEQNEQKK